MYQELKRICTAIVLLIKPMFGDVLVAVAVAVVFCVMSLIDCARGVLNLGTFLCLPLQNNNVKCPSSMYFGEREPQWLIFGIFFCN